jgi:hypothetical protein
LSFQAEGDDQRLDGQAELIVGPVVLNGAGHVETPFASPVPDLALRFAHGDAAALTSWLTGAHRGMTGAVSATAKLTREEDTFKLSDLRGLMSGQELTGELALNQRLTRPHVSGRLAFRPVETGGDDAIEVQEDGWSHRALPLAWMGLVDVDLSLLSAELGEGLTNATGRLVGNEGRFTLQDAGVDWAGGRVSGEAQAIASPLGAEISTDLSFEEVRLEQLVGINDQMFRPTGSLSGSLSVATLGASEADWISRLAGEGEVILRDLNGPSSLGNRLPVPTDRPLVDRLQADLDVLNGVISTRDVIVVSDFGNGSAAVQADLPQWRLDGRLRLDAEEGTGLPPVRVQLVGPLNGPETVVTMEALPPGLFGE